MAAQREWLDKDYYKVLGVSKDTPAKDITKKYRKLARELHPDANPGDTAAEDRFKEVSAAYDVLGDDAKRAEYDELRRLGPMGGSGLGGSGFDPGAGNDLGDLLGSMFGRGNRRGGGATGPVAGADLEAELHLSFVDAVQGRTTSVHLTSEASCRECKGSGSAPGTRPQTCGQCQGRGVLDDDQGFFSFSRPCPSCAGRGSIITEPCSNCAGSGTERRPREVKVAVPAGVKDGQRIRLAGKGEPGRNGGPKGDLYVRVHVAGHDTFGRRGNHVTLTAPITFAEAALGARVTVPTLDGPSVTLKVPAGTPTGKTFRIKGRGVQSKKKAGDLLVTVEVVVPTELSEAERDALEALAVADTSAPRSHLLPEHGDSADTSSRS